MKGRSPISPISPPLAKQVLQVLMQTSEIQTSVEEWG